MVRERLSADQLTELNKLLTTINLQRMRGQGIEAEETCRKALEISPSDPAIHETLSDLLYERGMLDEALKEIKVAMELQPGKPSIEKKHAKIVLEIGEREYEKALVKDMMDNPHKYVVRERKPGLALLLALIPGLGQFYNHELIKAGIVFGTFLLFIVSFGLFQPDYPPVTSVQEILRFTNPTVQVLGFLSLTAYIYGLVDAPVSAEKSSKGQKQSEI